MVITNYRVQSVLRTYTRQLQRSKLTAKTGSEGGGDSGVERVSISDEGKRRLMMDRLASQVLVKMRPKQDGDAGPIGTESEGDNGPAMEGNQ